MIANIGSIRSMWPRFGSAFAFRRRPYWSRLMAELTLVLTATTANGFRFDFHLADFRFVFLYFFQAKVLRLEVSVRGRNRRALR